MSTFPSTSDFYIVGGTLPAGAPSYVKRPADDEIFRHLLGGKFCNILTPRQMGKSSLMTHTAKRLRDQGVKTAIVDLNQIGTVENPDIWYRGILRQIRNPLSLAFDPLDWWEQEKNISSHQKFFEFFKAMLFEIEEQVVIFIDEIDMALDRGFRDDFFVVIRSMTNARAEQPEFNRLTFALLGVASPADLIRDRNRTPYNIGQEVSLEPFSRTDAEILEQGLEAVYTGHGKKILDRIFYWTNGHPYLTQKLCQAMVEKRLARFTSNDVDKLVEKLFLSAEASRESSLQFVRDNILNSEQRQEMLAIYERLLLIAEDERKGIYREKIEEDKSIMSHNRLKLSGLATAKNGTLIVSNLIYQKVFELKWVKENQQKLVGRRFGDYVVLEVLSKGQWGSSLKARNRKTGELVVLKAFEQGTLTRNAQEASLAEIESLKRLESGHGIRIPREIFEQEGIFFIVSDYAHGGNLRQILTNGISVEEILDIFTQIAQTIDYIHSKNIIHRDIKPENILCDTSGGKIITYLTDFEIAKILDFTLSSYSTETVSGTPLYMAPEAFDLKKPKTNAIDIYAFGVMLYEAFEGKVPFEDLTEKLNVPVPFPEKTKNLTNSEATELLIKALENEPEERPESALKIIDGIRSAFYESQEKEKKWVGHTFKHYLVEEVLGVGKMGITLLAMDMQTSKHVVLKAFEHSLFGTPPLTFDKEMANLERLENRHGILTPQETFEEDDVLFIVTDYQSGGTLRQLLSRRPKLTLKEILEIFSQVAEAIDYIHENKIVHRDIKPENVVCKITDGKVSPFLTDFGISFILASARSYFHTEHGTGIYRYIAPELWKPSAKKTKAVDIYAFGIMLYEALEGQAPFDAEYPAIMHQHLSEPVPAAKNTFKELGDKAHKILIQALAKDAEERPKTATEIMQQIKGQHTMFIGQRYGKYTIDKFIGQGAYGATYQAYDSSQKKKKIRVENFINPYAKSARYH